MNYITTTIMQLKKGFGKFRKITEKIKIFMYNVNGPFRVENPILQEIYKANPTHPYIFLIKYLRYAYIPNFK